MTTSKKTKSPSSMAPQMKSESVAEMVSPPTIVWIFGKGGVGKSQVAEVAYIALQTLGHEVCALDADVSNSSLARKVSQATLVNGGNADEIVDNIEQAIVREVLGNHKSMIVDTGNGSDKSSRRWFASQNMATILSEHGVNVLAVTVVDSSLDSASHVLETMDALAGASHVVVMNLGHVPGDIGEKAFSALLADDEFKKYLQSAHVITLPRLPDVVTLEAAGAHLNQIADETNEVPLSPFVMARTQSWLVNVVNQFINAIAHH